MISPVSVVQPIFLMKDAELENSVEVVKDAELENSIEVVKDAELENAVEKDKLAEDLLAKEKVAEETSAKEKVAEDHQLAEDQSVKKKESPTPTPTPAPNSERREKVKRVVAIIFAALAAVAVVAKAIFAVIKKIHQKTFKKLLDKIKNAAYSDLYLDEEHIAKKFGIGKALGSLSTEEGQQGREELRVIINRAFVQRELKERGKLAIGDQEEAFLLECLGYNVSSEDSSYQNKQAIHGAIQRDMEAQLLPENYKGSLSTMKGVVQKKAMEVRLNAAGIRSPDQITKFREAQKLLKDTRDQLTSEAAKYSFKVPDLFPLSSESVNLQVLRSNFEMHKQSIIDDFLKHVFGDSHLREAFRQGSEDFGQLLQRHVAEKMARNEEKLAKKFNKPLFSAELDFFQNWGKYLRTEMVQGFGDEQAVLIEGICFGLCQNLQIQGINHPDLSLEELSEKNSISATQRFFQGIHTGGSKIEGLNILPVDFAHKHGVEEKGIFSIVDRSYIFKLLKESNPHLSETSSEVQNLVHIRVNGIKRQYCMKDKDITISSNDLLMEVLKREMEKRDLTISQGWVRLSLSGAGHTIALRIDERNQKAWLFDPNIGFFAFEKPEIGFTESQNQCLNCLRDLLNLHYPKTYGIQVTQLHPYKKS